VKLTVSRFSSHPPRLGEGATIANRFRLVRQIGEGGMGSVWLATHLGLGIPCAVKFVEGEWRRQPEMVARFEREAKVEAQLRSPHVVHVLDHGVWNGTPYIAMEFLQGESVSGRLERVGRLDTAATHRLVAHVARALTRAHAIGIVHRDLKPENIFLVPDDEGEIAKVLDFGVAKWNTDWAVNNVTKTGLLVGTPLYMSPEQARGTKDIDFRADLWSLAVIAFQCMTGSLPFISEGLGDLLAKIMFEPIPMPSSIVPYLPLEFDAWWERASSRDIEKRCQSAKELSDSLAVALGLTAASTVAAAPPGFREAAMSDYSLSVSAHESSQNDQLSGNPLWPSTGMGKLLGVGVVGVSLIAGAMFLQKSHAEPKPAPAAVAPVTPGVAVPGSTAVTDPALAAALAPAPKAEPSAAGAGKGAPASKLDHKEPPGRRGTFTKDLPREAPPAPPRAETPSNKVPAAPAPPAPAASPNKPKDVDFGI
jgi:serine/threonine-protein kinase